jgi:ribosome-binding factor A
MSRRTERVASTIQQELGQIMLRELNDPRLVGLPSITRVKVSEDLSQAEVFVTVMGTAGQKTAAVNALRHAAGLMRTRLTRQMTLRVAPFLKFSLDEDLQKELELMEALRKVSEENAELDRLRSTKQKRQESA